MEAINTCCKDVSSYFGCKFDLCLFTAYACCLLLHRAQAQEISKLEQRAKKQRAEVWSFWFRTLHTRQVPLHGCNPHVNSDLVSWAAWEKYHWPWETKGWWETHWPSGQQSEYAAIQMRQGRGMRAIWANSELFMEGWLFSEHVDFIRFLTELLTLLTWHTRWVTGLAQRLLKKKLHLDGLLDDITMYQPRHGESVGFSHQWPCWSMVRLVPELKHAWSRGGFSCGHCQITRFCQQTDIAELQIMIQSTVLQSQCTLVYHILQCPTLLHCQWLLLHVMLNRVPSFFPGVGRNSAEQKKSSDWDWFGSNGGA